nr:L,D-transpeptidase family protein [uncultured Dorea sp.]
MKKIVKKIAALIMAATVGITSPALIYADEAVGTVHTQDNQSENNIEIENNGTIENIEEDKDVSKAEENSGKKGESEQTDVEDKDVNAENPDKDSSQEESKKDDTDESQDVDDSNTEEPAEEKVLDVQYEVHMQNLGWIDVRTNGETAGDDAGKNHMEAIRIQVPQEETTKLDGSIIYQAHVSDIGWQDEVTDGQMAGTTGQSKAIEALKIRLTGQFEEKYDVYYRVCSEKKGWFGWAKNGELAGSVGFSYGVKAIQVRIYAKDAIDKPVQDAKASLTEGNMGEVIYQTHVSDIGWQKKVADGAEAGTTGQSKAVEALNIKLSDEWEARDASVLYEAHVANIGWQDEVMDGAMAGTTGEGKAMEAIRIKVLNGDSPDGIRIDDVYDIYYRVHISDYGWLAWTCNGKIAGSVGYGLPIEAIQIKLVRKDSTDKPDTSGRAYLSESLIHKISYSAHVSNIGWQSYVSTGEVAGTTGQGRNMEALQMMLPDASAVGESGINYYDGGIEYRAHVSDIGWQNWVRNNEIAGTTGQGKKMEALQIRLTGEMQKYCDIYYRAHVSNFGWLGWAKNGEMAGTTGFSYGMEAIQIVVVPKNTAAPGNTNDHYREKKFTEMELRANLYSSSTPYLLMVNRSRHKVYIFQGYRGNWKQIRKWYCGDGAASTPTVEGTFKVQSRGYYFDSGSARCYWWTQFYGNYLFHSVLYHKDGTLMDGRVGMALSHGCVRLEIQNAKWIYDTIPSGSTVVVYH